MAYSYIGTYVKPHGSGEGGGGTTIINKGRGNSNYNADNLTVTTLNAHNATIDNLTATNANIDNCEFVYVMSTTGVITKLSGDELNYQDGKINNLTSDEIVTNKLTVKDEANIKNLIADYIQSTNITTDYLTVNKSAHFFELIIDKIRSVQGTQMNTAANCIVDYVEAYDIYDHVTTPGSNEVEYYRIYWRNKDNDGREITNDWLINDQAICESFNVGTGTSYNTQNKYYWRLVINTSNSQGESIRYINFANNEVRTTAPQTFEIVFTNGFAYGDTNNSYNSFNITSQILGQWDSTNSKWTPTTTLYGLQVTPVDDDILLMNGHIMFTTSTQTKLNVGVYYTDGTFDYFQASNYTNSYDLTCSSTKVVEAIIINTAVIDKWDACNWIDVSDVDMDSVMSGKSVIPSAGDNVCQLGYRYDQIPVADRTQDDIARASAIIIAAYKTPDSGVKPPSYAQYQDIGTDSGNNGRNRWNLGLYRKSYFDATGAYFKGNLVAGTTIDSGVSIPVSVDVWRILADTSIITRDNQNQISPSTIHLTLLYNNGSTTQTITTLPSDKLIYVNNVLNSNGLTVNVTSFNDLTIQLKDINNTQTFDKTVIETFDINATNGTNGSYYQFIYKNAETRPSTPTSSSFPPSGWSTSATSPLVDEYTWMSQRVVSYDSSNQAQYGSWTTPVRISGEDGEMGRDGNGVEFIYFQTEDDTRPNLYQSYTDLKPQVSNYSSSIVEFQIRPGDTGYDSNTNLIQRWTVGVHDHIRNNGDYLPPSYKDLNGLTSEWSDEPQGVDDTYLYEWVSMRTYDGDTQTWSRFSTPVVWAKYGENGINGVNGINGADGADGEMWKLIPIKKYFEVRIDTGNNKNYDNVKGTLYTDLAFTIAHIVGQNVTYLTQNELNDYSLTLITDNITGQNRQNVQNISSITIDGTTFPVLTYQNNNYLTFTANTQTGNNIDYYYLVENGLTSRMPTRMNIELIKNSTVKKDGYTIDLSFKTSHIFTTTDAALNSVYQGLSGDLTGNHTTGFSTIRQQWDGIKLAVNNITTLSEGGFPQNNDNEQYAFQRNNSSLAPNKPVGNISNTGVINNAWTTYNMEPSQTYQYTWISERTKPLMSYTYSPWSEWSDPSLFEKYGTGRGGVNSAQLNITAEEISTNVYNTNPNGYQTSSQVSQTATSISAAVKTTIEGELQTTGIDITQGTIDLKADKVTFSNSSGTVNDKISIDPTTGTLNATNANISGVLTANVNYTPFIRVTNSDCEWYFPAKIYRINLDDYITGANNKPLACKFDFFNSDTSDYSGLDAQIVATLPTVTNRAGLELMFTSFIPTRIAYGFSRLNSPNDASFVWPDPTTGVQQTANYIWIVPNNIITMVAIGNAWLITNGAFWIEDPHDFAQPTLIRL